MTVFESRRWIFIFKELYLTNLLYRQARRGAYAANQIKTRWRHVTSSKIAARPASATSRRFSSSSLSGESVGSLRNTPSRRVANLIQGRSFSSGDLQVVPNGGGGGGDGYFDIRRLDDYAADTEDSSPDHNYRIRSYSLYQYKNKPPLVNCC